MMLVVITPDEAVTLFEFIKSNVVVATTPLVVLVRRIELVDDELERVLVVLDANKSEAAI